jgi:hypothetical protein
MLPQHPAPPDRPASRRSPAGLGLALLFAGVLLLVLSACRAPAGLSPARPHHEIAGWTLEGAGEEPAVRHARGGRRLPLTAHGAGGVLLLDLTPAPSPAPRGVHVLRYVAGGVGTTERLLVVRALVFAQDAPDAPPRPLADQVHAYLDARDERSPRGPQPLWEWSGDALHVLLPDARDRERYPLN